ncbi:cell division protein FtsZ [Aureivirga marina]|uniref:cell division protein FtsZ n=1 Tax=Aureivirga marina TaxID=1182451 RepID=UPI001E4A05AD|nr:cell division protein FtsZ [Aureivirga marina]
MGSTEFNNISFDLPKNQSNVIKVIGVGGGGSNAVNHMYLQGINGVDFVVCNTDAQALQNSPVPHKIQLGVSLTEGLGAGANPEIGEQSAMESIEEIKSMLSTKAKMVFITVGMGGGTGTGAAPIIAKMAKELDLLTIGIVTIPFSFEGKMRNDQAQVGIETLRNYVDSLVVINNNKLREVYGNLGFKAGFSKADEVLSTAARGIAEVITHHYTQNIDLKDAKTVLSNSGTAIMGSATASGTGRASEAISKALDSPLLNDNKITGAQNVLLLIVSGTNEITIDEIGEINDYIQSEAQTNVNIIMGVGDDEALGDAVSVTVIATGFNLDQQNDISNTEAKKIIHNLDTNEKETPIIKETTPVIETPVTEVPEETISLKTTSNPPKDSGNAIHDMDVTFEEIRIHDVDEVPSFDIQQEVLKKENQEASSDTQTSFSFDLNPSTDIKTEKDVQNSIQDIEVVDYKQIEPEQKVDEKIYYSLDDSDSTDDDKNLQSKNDLFVTEDDLNFNIRTENEPEAADDSREISPLDLTISELQKRARERREKMKEFNYKFVNKVNQNIDDIEKEPAYKRMGVELNQNISSSQTNQSRTSLETDDKDDLKFRSNNSFLHDNVD